LSEKSTEALGKVRPYTFSVFAICVFLSLYATSEINHRITALSSNTIKHHAKTQRAWLILEQDKSWSVLRDCEGENLTGNPHDSTSNWPRRLRSGWNRLDRDGLCNDYNSRLFSGRRSAVL